MSRIIDTQPYDEKISRVFRDSVFSYHKASYVSETLHKIKEEAFTKFKQKQFYEAAAFYKSLLSHALDYLQNVKEDTHGFISDFIFECITYFSQSIKQLRDIDKGQFFEESLYFFLEEDLGFADEISKLILDNCERDDYDQLETSLEKHRKQILNLGTYKYEKFIMFVLRFYRKFQNYTKYLEVCRWFPTNRWEHYVYAAEIYEAQQQWDAVERTYKDGASRVKEKDKEIIQQRYLEYRHRIGLA